MKVALPEKIVFSTQLTVQVGDLNYGNHLSNDAMLRLAHEARLRWLASMNMNEMNAGGAGLIMRFAQVQYVAQAFYGDVLQADLGVNAMSAAAFELNLHLWRTSDKQSIAKIVVGMAFFDYAQQRATRMPQTFKDVLLNQEFERD
ncbi:MAG: thioesterase family protein [Neisseria sp.]|nr:thioesterase family protein [Neisseria sp.]